jgi:hypothetical protein
MRREADFAPPIWIANQPGMSGSTELRGIKLLIASTTWQALTAIVKLGHWALELCGLHKQYANRWLEPIVWVDGVISSTDWDNFLKLRNHPSAQPEIRNLAWQIEKLLTDNEPDFLEPGEWHLPYIDQDGKDFEDDWDSQCLISMGRCARVSYGLQDTSDPEIDIARARRLLESDPMHVSPAEHQAMVQATQKPFKSGNFRNWEQFRKRIEP